MKKLILKCTISLSFIFLTNMTFAQDMIILKNGEEIKSKVIEVSSDLIKYKKWENQEGPTYSSNKSEVFMIKYENGTKDVFNQSSNSENQSTQNLSKDDIKNDAFETLNKYFKNRFNNDKVFLMLGLDKSNGVMKNIYGQSVYEIDYKLKLKFISDAWVKSFNGRVFFDKNFTTYDKEPTLNVFGTTTSNAHLFNKGKIYIFSGTATMENTDNGYILKDYDIKGVDYGGMDSKYPDINNSDGKMNFIGHYDSFYSIGEYKNVDGIYFKSNMANINSVIFDVNGVILDAETTDLTIKGSQGKNQFLTAKITVEGFKRIDGKYNYDLSVFTMYNGQEYDKKENMDWDSLIDPLVVKMVYNTPSLKAGSTNFHTFYISFFIKDKYSEAIIQGFYKYTLKP